MILKIKEYREEFEMTQRELAEKIGSTQRNVSHWENDVNEPDCETILRIAEIFDISIDELFGREKTTFEDHRKASVEYAILKYLRELTDTQKYAFLQLLKELVRV